MSSRESFGESISEEITELSLGCDGSHYRDEIES